jgi:hypothetical protein
MKNDTELLIENMGLAQFMTRRAISLYTPGFTSRREVCDSMFMECTAFFVDHDGGDSNSQQFAEILTRILGCCGDWLNINLGQAMYAAANQHRSGSTEEIISAPSPWRMARLRFPEPKSDHTRAMRIKAMGRIAKALESHDHLEDYPSRAVLDTEFPVIATLLLAMVTDDDVTNFRLQHHPWVNVLFVDGWGQR